MKLNFTMLYIVLYILTVQFYISRCKALGLYTLSTAQHSETLEDQRP